jgi:hypothetical protein
MKTGPMEAFPPVLEDEQRCDAFAAPLRTTLKLLPGQRLTASGRFLPPAPTQLGQRAGAARLRAADSGQGQLDR